MKKRSKRYNKSLEAVEKDKTYILAEAVAALKKTVHAKFDETVEISCHLNVDTKKTDQLVRGTTVLPHGIGKNVRVCVFCKGEDINKAKEAGADYVGGVELIEKVKKGWLDFDKAASTLEMMREVAQLGKVLGPRGMMPSPKVGTVGADIQQIIKELKAGKVQFKADKTGNIHAAVGKISFAEQQLMENAMAMIKAIQHARPAQIKGRYLNSVGIATSMSPGIKLDIAKL
ncbi:50S ribosomal protein L1 [Candidatus Omnitrophota bacterium]